MKLSVKKIAEALIRTSKYEYTGINNASKTVVFFDKESQKTLEVPIDISISQLVHIISHREFNKGYAAAITDYTRELDKFIIKPKTA